MSSRKRRFIPSATPNNIRIGNFQNSCQIAAFRVSGPDSFVLSTLTHPLSHFRKSRYKSVLIPSPQNITTKTLPQIRARHAVAVFKSNSLPPSEYRRRKLCKSAAVPCHLFWGFIPCFLSPTGCTYRWVGETKAVVYTIAPQSVPADQNVAVPSPILVNFYSILATRVRVFALHTCRNGTENPFCTPRLSHIHHCHPGS
jgi:hypothetical protein